MAYPHHPGSPSDPLHRRLPAGSAPHSPMQEYLNLGGYSGGPPTFGYDYDGSQGGQSPSHRPLPYPSPTMQGRQHLVPHPHDNLPPSDMTPTISFEYTQGGSQQHQQQQQQQQQHSYFANGMVDSNSEPNSNLGQDGSTSPFSSFHQDGGAGGPMYLGLAPLDWQSNQAVGSPAQQLPSTGPTKGNSKGNPNKVPRHQFTACGACRHRRVKCDLRARQEEAERESMIGDSQSGGNGPLRRRKVSCTNCQERGTNCVDEYAPLKAAKQLRRGKRISEIEMLYGKSATDAALASQGDEHERPLSPTGRKVDRLPDLTREFFDSTFFRRFLVQRPIIDSLEFVTRYLSKPNPCAAAMGPEGAVLCHCLYAWGISYGVNERGQLDVMEAGGETLGPLNLLNMGESELRREQSRQRRMEKLNRVVGNVLREIDEYSLLRRPSWDGIRAILLILPLTEGLATPVERQSMYQAALSHVQLLCTATSFGYDGLPVTLPVDAIPEDAERLTLLQMRIFWYAFVHESITAGLRGGNLALNEETDLLLLEQALEKQPLIQSPSHFHISPSMAAAPVRFALICRRIHANLSSSKARRRDLPQVEELHAIWDALEQSWDEFENLKNEQMAPPLRERDEVVCFADGWKIHLFEAQDTIRRHLEDRLERLQAKRLSMCSDDSNSRPPSPLSRDLSSDLAQVRHLLDLARTRCEIKVNQVTAIIRQHLGAQLFEWDASLVRDGTFNAAMLLARTGGSDDDVNICLQALNESRWAHSKSSERSQELRKAWFDKRSNITSPDGKGSAMDTGASSTASKSRNDSPFTSPTFGSFSSGGGAMAMSSSAPPSWPPTTVASGVPSAAGYSPHHEAQSQRSKSDPSAFGAFRSQSIMEVSKDQIHPARAAFTSTPPQGYLYGQVEGMSPQTTPDVGQYLLHQDGSHVFVPYGSHPML